MLTVFGAPKGFTGQFDEIQRNAVRSWRALGARVLLLGDEVGVSGAAASLGVEHLPKLRRNEHGTPLLDAAFTTAERVSADPLLCYANCDILLPPALVEAARAAADSHERFLLVGRCADVEPPAALDPSEPGWAERMAVGAPLRGHDFIDWFLYTRGLFAEMPPFALGRAAFDNWLVWHARSSGAAVIDASPGLLPLHQRHDHSHLAGGADWAYGGPEARRNVELAGGVRHIYTLLDATHTLEPGMHVRRRLGGIGRAAHRRHEARLALGRFKARVRR